MWGDEAAERHEMDQPSDPLREDGSPRLPTVSEVVTGLVGAAYPDKAAPRRRPTGEEREAFRGLLAQTFTARYGNDPARREEANALVSAEAERIYGPLLPGFDLLLTGNPEALT